MRQSVIFAFGVFTWFSQGLVRRSRSICLVNIGMWNSHVQCWKNPRLAYYNPTWVILWLACNTQALIIRLKKIREYHTRMCKLRHKLYCSITSFVSECLRLSALKFFRAFNLKLVITCWCRILRYGLQRIVLQMRTILLYVTWSIS